MAPQRRKALPEVMGSTEAASAIGVKVQNLGAIPDLPEPDQIIAAGRVWRADTIREFAKVYKTRQRSRQRAQTKRAGDPEQGVAKAAA